MRAAPPLTATSLLRESGCLLQVETVNGGARYSLSASELSTKPMAPKGLAPLSYQPNILRTLHEAVTKRRKLRIRYRGANNATPADRMVHSIELHVVDQQPCLLAWDDHKLAQRTFKVTRISHAKILRDKAQR